MTPKQQANTTRINPYVWRAVRAFQNNAPDYWLIFEGKSTFGADPIARVADEETARALIARHNAIVNLIIP